MNQTKSIIIVKFGNREIYLKLILELLIWIDFIQQALRKSSNDALFIVAYDILEELIDELHFEVGQIETSIVVAIVLIGEVQHDLIFFIFVLRVQEFVNQSIG